MKTPSGLIFNNYTPIVVGAEPCKEWNTINNTLNIFKRWQYEQQCFELSGDGRIVCYGADIAKNYKNLSERK